MVSDLESKADVLQTRIANDGKAGLTATPALRELEAELERTKADIRHYLAKGSIFMFRARGVGVSPPGAARD